jgi:hypothetical protein
MCISCHSHQLDSATNTTRAVRFGLQPRGRSSLTKSTLVGQHLVELPERYDQLATELNEKFVATYGSVPDEPALCLVTGMPRNDLWRMFAARIELSSCCCPQALCCVPVYLLLVESSLVDA